MGEKLLYGSAFSAVLPPEAVDVSVFRQVPDNQEVFTHRHTDQSLIVEILEYVNKQEPDEMALKTHFSELSAANGAQDSNILHSELIPCDRLAMHQADSCWYALGEQHIAKFNEDARNTVQIHMGLFRLPAYETDILVTFNDPINISVQSSSHHAMPTSIVRWNTDHFKQMLCSFQLLDAGIFG